MSDELRFHSTDDLHQLSLEELQSLWELVPTERQRGYRSAYDREVRTAGAGGSDRLELELAEQLLARYQQTALVPVGARWVKAPTRVREAATRNSDLPMPENVIVSDGKHSPAVWVGFVLGIVVLVVMVFRLLGGSPAPEIALDLTETATPTPEISPTPTPLALEAQDNVITSGDRERAVAYPVNLQITTPDDRPPRVWVVQRRTVRAAEWNYDGTPDIASFVSGMSVRPLIGIPFSEENGAFFDELGDGAVVTVTMNTGAIIRYEFGAKSDVLRSDTAIFRQVSPGLVLLLIGETDADGLPTATRTLITATYPPEQDLARGGWLAGLESVITEGGIGDTLALGDVGLRLVNVHAVHDGTAPQQRLLFDIEATTDEDGAETQFWQMQLVDAGGQTHAPEYRLDESLPSWISPYGVLSAQVGFTVSPDFPAGTFIIRNGQGDAVTFRFTFTPDEQTVPTESTGFEDVSVQIVGITYQDDRLITQLRIYNGRREALTFTPDDISLSLGYTPDPPGPRNPALGLEPFVLLPAQAVNLSLTWYWLGEPYGALQVGGWRWGIRVER